jgi:hypothetical protein
LPGATTNDAGDRLAQDPQTLLEAMQRAGMLLLVPFFLID